MGRKHPIYLTFRRICSNIAEINTLTSYLKPEETMELIRLFIAIFMVATFILFVVLAWAVLLSWILKKQESKFAASVVRYSFRGFVFCGVMTIVFGLLGKLY